MKQISHIFLICSIIFPTLALISCRSKYEFAATKDILNMEVVEVFVAEWEEPRDDFENLVFFRKAMTDPKNWKVFFKTKDPEGINKIMFALRQEPIKEFKMAGSVWEAILFKDKKGNIKSTTLDYDFEKKQVYLADRIYGEKLFDILQNQIGFTYESKEEILERFQHTKPSDKK